MTQGVSSRPWGGSSGKLKPLGILEVLGGRGPDPGQGTVVSLGPTQG